MLMRDGLVIDLKDDWRAYTARKLRGQDVFDVGGHRYDLHFKPLSPGAPEIVDAWDFQSGWKQHKRGRNAKEAEIRERIARGHAEEAQKRLLAGPDGWKHLRPLSTLPRDKSLRITCKSKRCGRVRFDAIGFLSGEGRFGERTVADLERAFSCRGCGAFVAISLD